MSAPYRPSSRDSRIDWLRGLALISIFINHMPGNRLEHWTSRNFGFSDAAEVFVLLAGVAAALAFFRKFEAGETARMSLKALHRAGVLYVAHIAISICAIGMLIAAAWILGDTGVYDLIGASALFEQPLPGLIGLATGGFQLGYFNILPLYVVLLVALPAYLLLAKIDPRLMLAASAALYATAMAQGWQPIAYPDANGWFFNPFAWQLLYATGVYLGILKLRGQSVGWHPIAGAVAGAYLVYSLVWVLMSAGGHITFGLLPPAVDTLAKSNLPMSRYLHVVAAAYVLVHSPIWTMMQRIAAQNSLVLMGRHSLPVFAAGSILSLAGYLILTQTGPWLVLELALTTLGLAIMAGVAWGCQYGVQGMRTIAAQYGRSATGRHVVEVDDEITTRTR